VPGEADLDQRDAEQVEAERFVDAMLPPDRVLKVLDIKASEQRFEIRKPI
jgi:hypothetical protein